MKGIIYKSSLFLVSLAKQIVPVISSDKVEIYSESFRRSANKPNYRPADEASLIQVSIDATNIFEFQFATHLTCLSLFYAMSRMTYTCNYLGQD